MRRALCLLLVPATAFAAASQGCRDTAATAGAWADTQGNTCATYVTNKWCGAGTNARYANHGVDADSACCACGGGGTYDACDADGDCASTLYCSDGACVAVPYALGDAGGGCPSGYPVLITDKATCGKATDVLHARSGVLTGYRAGQLVGSNNQANVLYGCYWSPATNKAWANSYVGTSSYRGARQSLCMAEPDHCSADTQCRIGTYCNEGVCAGVPYAVGAKGGGCPSEYPVPIADTAECSKAADVVHARGGALVGYVAGQKCWPKSAAASLSGCYWYGAGTTLWFNSIGKTSISTSSSVSICKAKTMGCADVGGWADSSGNKCSYYEAQAWCGQIPTNGQYATNGVDADAACCACGGGTPVAVCSDDDGCGGGETCTAGVCGVSSKMKMAMRMKMNEQRGAVLPASAAAGGVAAAAVVVAAVLLLGVLLRRDDKAEQKDDAGHGAYGAISV